MGKLDSVAGCDNPWVGEVGGQHGGGEWRDELQTGVQRATVEVYCVSPTLGASAQS